MPLFGHMERQAAQPPPVIHTPPARTVHVPRRLQRSRRRGAKLPEGAVYVGRPTFWANPFRFERFGHARSVLMHQLWLEARLGDMELERRGFCSAEIDALHRLRERAHGRIATLRRKDLVCWCPLTSSWCHADALLRLANEDISRADFFR